MSRYGISLVRLMHLIPFGALCAALAWILPLTSRAQEQDSLSNDGESVEVEVLEASADDSSELIETDDNLQGQADSPDENIPNIAEAPASSGPPAQPQTALPDDSPRPPLIEEGPPEEVPDERRFFHGEPPPEGGLPEFAEKQPGFLPDHPPSDIRAREPETVPGFDSLLGPSRLPGTSVADTLRVQRVEPGHELEDNNARIVVPDGTITGSTDNKQFHIEGGMILYYRDVTITADTADIDEKNEMAVMRGEVYINDPKYSLKTDELRVFFEDKRFQAEGFVQFRKTAEPDKQEPDFGLPKKDRLREYFAGQEFELYCKSLYYNWDTKELAALDSVRIVHPSFNGTMERVDYNDETKLYEMSGKVVIDVSQYDWIFENKLVDEEDEDKVRALTDGNTKVTCERVLYSEEGGIAQFYATTGEVVRFEQPKRSVSASYIEVNDNTKDFYAEGEESRLAVYEQQDGRWLFEGGLINEDEVSEELVAALEKQLTAEAQTITYNFDRKRVELHSKVKIETPDHLLQAGEVVQDETAKFFLLRGNILIVPDKDSQIRAAQVYLDTENDVATFVGLVEGNLKSEDIPSAEGEEPGTEGFEAQPGVFQQQGMVPGATGRGVRQAESKAVEQPSKRNVAEGG